MQGVTPFLTQQQITTRSRESTLGSPGTPQLTRTTNPRTYAGARRTAQPAGPAPIVTPPANHAAAPPVVVGYNDACPPSLYVLKDKICPYHNEGCQYRTHIQNLLTRHVVRMHNPDFRQNYRRPRAQPQPNPPTNVEPDEEEFGEIPQPRLSPRSIRKRHEPTTPQNTSFETPSSTTRRHQEVQVNPHSLLSSPAAPTPTSNYSVPSAGAQTLGEHTPFSSLSRSIQMSPPETRLLNTSVNRTSSSHAPPALTPHQANTSVNRTSSSHASPALTPHQPSSQSIALPSFMPPVPPSPVATSSPLVQGVSPIRQHSPVELTNSTPMQNLFHPRHSSTPHPAEEIFLGNNIRHYNTDPHDITEIKSFQLGENFTMMVCGPSDSGKTVFIAQLIVNKENICEIPPQRVVSVYCNNEGVINDLPQINVKINVNEMNEQQFNAEGLENFFIKQATAGQGGDKAPHSLLVFDDCQMKPNLVKAISGLFNGSARHNNISVIYVGQKLFDGHEQNRISTNAKYLVLFKNSRFKNESGILNRQINPGRPGILAAMLDTLNPHEHLLINFEPRLRDKKLQYLTNLFLTNHVVPVFVPLFR